MFDIGFPELVLIAIVGLLVIGPERLPEALRTLGLWLGRMRRSFTTVKAEIEKEIGMDEVRRQLHNEAIMDEMKRIESEVKNTANTVQASINDGVKAMEAPSIDPGASIATGSHADATDSIAAQDNIGPPRDSPSDFEAGDLDNRSDSDEAASPGQTHESMTTADEKTGNG